MEKMTHHPLRACEDTLKRALVLSGFTLFDDKTSREIIAPEWNMSLSKLPDECFGMPIMLENGHFMLRTELLASQLPNLKGILPLRSFACGVAYDGADAHRPNRLRIQGIWADERIPTRLWLKVWEQVVHEAYGLTAGFDMVRLNKDAYRIDVRIGDCTFALAHIARATSLPYALLGLEKDKHTIWMFDIDVDSVACATYKLADRDQLYSMVATDLERFESEAPSFGSFFVDKATDVLRKQGYANFYGPRFYEPDCYKKMHMIQEGWDRNNQGILLVEPLGDTIWLPTVLTPSLEEALAQNYHAGVKDCRLFEFGHIYLPHSDSDMDFRERSRSKRFESERGPRDITDKTPIEKIALSIGGYGPDLTPEKWKAEVQAFLNALGFHENYYLDTMQAIAYDTYDCHLLFNDKMRYQMANLGTIHHEALANFDIDVPAYIAQFEFAPLEAQAAWEMIFVPIEYR